MTTSPTNLTIQTPIGPGTLQLARYLKGQEYRYLVRLTVTDAVKAHLGDSSCLTPRSTITALFSFTAEELGLDAIQKPAKVNKPGFWACPECGAQWFSGRPACGRCGTSRPGRQR